jgi:Cu(I)/Ag(I) efflux system membrane protein CusA/SilA
MIETTIKLKPKDQWRPGITIEDIKNELNQIVQVPSLTNTWIMPIKNRIDMLATGIKTPVGVKVAGPDLAVIAKVAEDIEKVIKSVPGTSSVYAERVTGGRYVTVDINRAAASRYGLNIKDVQDIVRTAIGGMTVSSTVEGRERYPINVRYPRDARDSVEQIRLLPVITARGSQIPLSEVADVKVVGGPGMIRSENARLNGWIYVDISERDIGSYVQDAKRAVAEQIDLPAGYSVSWSGQYEFMERAKQKLSVVIPVTIAIIVILLFLNFRNLIEVGIIIGTLPFSLVGGIWLMYLLDYNFSVAVGVGFIALAGVAVEIGVLMLVYLNNALDDQLDLVSERPVAQRDIDTAVVEGALMRIRPIMMTFTVVIAGLLPIMLGDGTGSEIMRRIAAPMVGGMISATILALLIIPAVFVLWKRRLVREANAAEVSTFDHEA